MRQRGDDGHIGAGFQLQVEVGLDVRRVHQVDAARIDDDQPRPLPQPLLQPRREHRVPLARIGADDHHHIGVLDRLEGLRAGRGAVGLAQAVAGRAVADAGAGVDVVGAEGGADQLLHEVGFLVGAAARRDAADRIAAVGRLDAAELAGGVAQGLVPAHLAPRVGDPVADHRPGQAVLVRRVAPGEAALDAAVALVGLAVLPRRHAHDLRALHLGLERAAHAAVGAGGDDAVLGLAEFDHRLLGQRRGRAGLHAGAAGDALALHERLVHARRDPRLEAAARDRQRERALHLLAGAHAAVADDALARVVGEVRVGFVLGMRQMVAAGDAGHRAVADAIAHVAHTDHAGLGLQLAVAVGGAGQTVERMVAEVELHHALAQLLQPRALGAHRHAGLGRRGARGRRAAPPLDLDQAEPARAEGLEAVGGAELGHLDAGVDRRAHQRGALRHGDLEAVDAERDGLGGSARRRAAVDLGLAAGVERPDRRDRLDRDDRVVHRVASSAAAASGAASRPKSAG